MNLENKVIRNVLEYKKKNEMFPFEEKNWLFL